MTTTLVLQKEVIDELFIRENEFPGFMKFIKKNFRDYNLITNYKDELEFKKHSIDNPLLDIIFDKFDSIAYIEDLNNKINDGSFLKKCSSRTLVISSLPLKSCNQFLNKNCILFFCLENLNEWDLYHDIVYSKSYKVTKDQGYPSNIRFKSFDDITKYLKHCNSIIIFDKYILCNKANKKKVNNIYKLLESILHNRESFTNITIITEFEREEIVSEYNSIITHLNAKGYTKFELDLIHHCKAFYPSKVEYLHSRFILSNFVHILCNDSFNFFKDNGEFNNLVDIDAKLCLSTNNKPSYKKDLDTIKAFVQKTINSQILTGNLKTTYYKNKNNPLLN